MSSPAAGGALPEPVRQRVVRVAAASLGELAPEDIPGPLRRIAKFEPRRRARLGAGQIAVALESDADFRALVADRLRADEPALAAAVEAGGVPAAADPVEVAAAAYLLHPDGWQELVAAAREGQPAAPEAAGTHADRLRDELAATRAAGERECAALREQLEAARSEIRMLRARVHDERARGHAAEAATREARDAAETARTQRASALDDAARAQAEARRLRSRVAELEGQAESARKAARAERAHESVRLAVLVDALVSAAQGLRRELALPTVSDRPADAVASELAREPDEQGPEPRRDEGPELFDRLLAVPQAHLLVDGYNVTKEGWPELTLEAQRSRLLAGLARLAAAARTELTCVFDGSDVGGRVPAGTARGVRVLFSRPGVTADELIAELLSGEPAGRRVIVVSSDREVADHARRAGAHPVPSSVLVARISG